MANYSDRAGISSSQITDGSIVNADINASAAIDGTKIVAASASVPGVVSREQSTIQTTLSLTNSFAGTGSINVNLARVGKMVTMTTNEVAPIQVTAVAAGQMSWVIPAGYRPSRGISFIIHAYINSTWTFTYGQMDPSGSVTIYKTTGVADFVISDTFRFVNGITISWVID
jgi:hypothetical protein